MKDDGEADQVGEAGLAPSHTNEMIVENPSVDLEEFRLLARQFAVVGAAEVEDDEMDRRGDGEAQRAATSRTAADMSQPHHSRRDQQDSPELAARQRLAHHRPRCQRHDQ